MKAWGQVTDLVLLALAEIGRGTYHDVADAADIDPESVRKALDRMARVPFAKRRVHIVSWSTDMPGARNYPRPVYAPGKGGNAKRPAPVSHTDATRNYYQRAQRIAQSVTGRHLPQKQATRHLAALRAKGVPL